MSSTMTSTMTNIAEPATAHSDSIELQNLSRFPSASSHKHSTSRPRSSLELLPQLDESADSHPDVAPRSSSPDSGLPGIPALLPVDGGKDAWLFLVGATVIEVLVWGLPFSVGILHTYWTNVLFAGKGGEGSVTVAATLQTGMMYMSAVVFAPIFTAYPHYRLHLQVFGLLAGSGALIGSAFVTKPWHLILTLGCTYPLTGLMYLPAATLLFEWFQAKRGLASGIMYAGTGAGGTVFPFVMSGLLSRFGYKVAMISLGLGFALFGSLALTVIKRRIPIPRASHPEASRRRKVDWSFTRRATLYAFTGTVCLTSLGNFIPSVWIPSFASDMNLTSPSGTVLISVMNAASVPGMALLGWASDHLPIRYVILLSCLGSALSCLFLWGFATNAATLLAFCIVFGALGPSFSAVWTKLISIIAKDDPQLPSLIFSIFAFFRGVGNITSGPVADSLLKIDVLRGATGAFGVDNYGVLLIYTGLTMLMGAGAGMAFLNE